MANYRVGLRPSAIKELKALDDFLINRIVPEIEDLGSDPRPAGSKKLKGYKDLWRIRVGDYRIVYAISDRHRTVEIGRIRHRSKVYE